MSNVIIIDFPFTEIEKDKKRCREKMKEATNALCGLLNSNGGVLKLRSPRKEVFNFDKVQSKFDDCIKNLLGSYKSCTEVDVILTSDENHSEVVYLVRGSKQICTVNCQLYIPLTTQINLIAPSEPLENIRRILTVTQAEEWNQLIKLGSHRKGFIQGKSVGCPESKTEQFKNVKSEATKSMTIAERIVRTANKFAITVSGFANHEGGHIYYGVKDNCSVEGEVIETLTKKTDIIVEVTGAVHKLVWPNGAPQRGKHWDIFFEPVMDNENKQIPSTFVVVVTVVQCPGGVFVQNPESYVILNGKVKEIPPKLWKECVNANKNCASLSSDKFEICVRYEQMHQCHRIIQLMADLNLISPKP